MALRFHSTHVAADRDSLGHTFRSTLFAPKLPSVCPTRAASRRKCAIQSVLPDVTVSLYNGLSANTHENIMRLHSAVIHSAGELGFSLPSQESASWWWAIIAPMALSYLFATPGSLAGLADFIYAPIHAHSVRSFSAEDVEIGKQLGEGSFGVVYEGFFSRGKKGSKSEGLHVVLKKAKTRVKGASEIHDSEIHMNYRLQRTSSLACAEFLGTMQVKPVHARGKLSEGVWLVWNFQGDRSLDYYLKQKIFPENLVPILFGKTVQEKEETLKWNAAAIKKIFKQILMNLQDLHRSGVVHRDVKPLNLILDQNSGKFKFIDFGACVDLRVDLRSGFNYVPNETVIDPTYAAPEHYVMPTSTPNLPPDPLCSLISPLIWHLNTPDRFDLYSAGLILMQLSMKSLRHDTGIQAFNTELEHNGYNLNKWRATCRHGKKEFAFLDADGGAGWELVTALLQPRHDRDHSIWPSLGSSRPSASAALRHRFLNDSIAIPKILPKELPDLALHVLPSFESVAQSLSSAVKKLDHSSHKYRERCTVEDDKDKQMKTKPFLFPLIPLMRPVSNAVSLGEKSSGLKDSKMVDVEHFVGASQSLSLKLASLSHSHILPTTSAVKEKINHALQGTFKGSSQKNYRQEADVSRQPEPVSEIKKAVKQYEYQGSPSLSDSMRNSPVFSSIGAALPTMTTSAISLATGWLVLSGLNISAQASYEFGKILMSSSGISGSAFIAFFLVIKPWLEEQGISLAKNENSKAPTVNEFQEKIHLEKLLAKDEDSKAQTVKEFQEKTQMGKYRSIYSEDSRVQLVVEAMQELDMHMSVLEALMLEEQQVSQQKKELVQRLERLLLQPPTR